MGGYYYKYLEHAPKICGYRNVEGRMPRNRQFKNLLDEGLSSVSRRQLKTVEAVEREIAEWTGYAQATVQHWRRGNIPAASEHVELLVRYCLQFGRLDQTWVQNLLSQARYPSPGPLLKELFPEGKGRRPRIFMCYQRSLEPDESVALELSQELIRRGYDVFFEQARAVDPRWVERVHSELEQCEFFVILLSAESVHNEVVLLELAAAHEVGGDQPGPPIILPVRLAYRQPFQESLSTYLDTLNWALWETGEDTPRLILELEQAISGGVLPIDEQARTTLLRPSESLPLALPVPSAELEAPAGTVDLQSPLYIPRDEDRVALSEIQRRGATITIKGPRQVGKSSLLVRTADAAKKAGKRVVFLDFQLLKSSLTDSDTFFRQFCALITHKLGLKNQVEDYWSSPLSNASRCTEYVGSYLLRTLEHPLVLAIDEADSIFATDFCTDFFAMLRVWHNNRAFDPDWKNLDLALVTSTEPYYFIDNLTQSPFNVGEVIDLQDFTPRQVADLNRRHGSPLSPDQEQQLMTLLNGHPYLVRRALYLIASRRITALELFTHATEDRGPFGDHLRSLMLRLHDKEDLFQALCQVESKHQCRDDQVFFRLRGAGLVRREGGQELPRCQLYADFFRGHLNG
jgi:hypothetical protein